MVSRHVERVVVADVQECRTRMFAGKALVECLENVNCIYCMNFGGGRFCIARSKLAPLASAKTVRETF